MSRKGKTSFEEKHQLVQACMRKEMGVCEAARITQVSLSDTRTEVTVQDPSCVQVCSEGHSLSNPCETAPRFPTLPLFQMVDL